MLIYDVDKIEDLYQEFEKVCKNFKNKEYDDFKTSYFYSCSDNVIKKLRNRIQGKYDNIQKGYDMIDKVWKEYIDDVGNFDKSVASGANCGIHDGGVSSIVSRICSIELYESASVSTSFKSIAASAKQILSATAATIVNVVFSILSGIGKFLESIVDGAVLVVGAVLGIIVAISDGITSLVSKDKNGFGITKEYFNGLLRLTGKDHMGIWKEKFYTSTGFGIWLDEHAADSFKSTGSGYDFGEAVGYVAGVIILTVLTFGIGSAISGGASAGSTAATFAAKTVTIGAKEIAVSKIVTGTIAGVAAAGKSEQKSYQSRVKKEVKAAEAKGIKLDEEDVVLNLSGGDMARIYASSAVQGVVEGWSFAATYGNGVKDWRMYKKADDIAQYISREHKDKIVKNVVEKPLKATIAAGKEVAKGLAGEIDGQEVNWKDVRKNAATAAAISFIYDSTGLGSKITGKASSVSSKIASKVDKDDVLEQVKNSYKEEMSKQGIDTNAMKETLDSIDMDDPLFDSTYKASKEIAAKNWEKAHKYIFDGAKKPVGTTVKKLMKDTVSEVRNELSDEAA